MNADGSKNSCVNPARYGSTLSFFMHGVGGESFGFQPPSQLSNVQWGFLYCPAAGANASLIDGLVYKVDVTLPASVPSCAGAYSNLPVNFLWVTFRYNGNSVGPLSGDQTYPMTVWVTK